MAESGGGGASFGDPRLPLRFWAKVRIGAIPNHRPDLGPCWEWTAYRTGGGYGRFRIGSLADGSGRLVLAHRLAFEALTGAVPQGLEPDHLCRNSPCVNPAHLEPVTHAVNIQRSPLMGHGHREARGEANSNAKLREADIPVIRALRGKMSQTEVAGWFGVGPSVISRIQGGKSWGSTHTSTLRESRQSGREPEAVEA